MRRLPPVPALVAVLILAACVPKTPYTRDYVSKAIEGRTGHALAPPDRTDDAAPPPGVSLEDGLTEDEAVATALWNNAPFRAALSDLTLARAQLAEAGLLPNPLVSFLYLFGVKGREGYVLYPIDAVWQRPKRVASAKNEAGRIAEGLVQSGLQLARDTIAAYTDAVLAETRAGLARESSRLRRDIASLAAAKLKAGEISGLEESTSRLDAMSAEDEALRAGRDAETARARLGALLGFADRLPAFSLAQAPIPATGPKTADELIREAYAARPDLKAAQLAVEAAAARLGWETSRIVKLTATLEAKEKGEAGTFVGPSGKLEIPIFNRNEGGRTRARAALERAAAEYVAARQSIAREVREAAAEREAARLAWALLGDGAVPAAKEASARAGRAYAAGEESYLFALEAERRALEARLRAASAEADLRRADARLRCATGFSVPGAER